MLAAAGFLAWASFAALPALSGRGFAEAWDTRAYWAAGLPLLALAHAAAGYATPLGLSRLPLWALAGHGVSAVLLHRAGSDAGLLPLALVIVALPLYSLLLAAAWAGRQLATLLAPA